MSLQKTAADVPLMEVFWWGQDSKQGDVSREINKDQNR